MKIFNKEDLCIACHEFRLKGQFLDSFSHWPKNTFHYFDDISQVLSCPLQLHCESWLPPSHVAVYFLIDWVCTYLGQYRVTTNSLAGWDPGLLMGFFVMFRNLKIDRSILEGRVLWRRTKRCNAGSCTRCIFFPSNESTDYISPANH